MNYPFVCPNCGHKEEISMKMSEYVSTGHMCPECNTEMNREITACRSIDKTGGFYRTMN